MLNWMTRLVWPAHTQPDAHAKPTTPRGRVVSGQYRSLYEYLANRYANTVVLTFDEIEDLLGFMLPDEARHGHEWWTTADPSTDGSAYSDSWVSAGRTATPNPLAKTVVFERAS